MTTLPGTEAGAETGAGAVEPGPEPRTAAPPAADPGNAFLAKAAVVTAVLTVAGSLLGLVRDQVLAHFFGAGSATDAFLVAWTVPEMAATLLIEDGLAFFLVPAFSLALARRAAAGGAGPGPDPVRALVAASLPRMTLWFVGGCLALIAAAPLLVAALAPGLPDPGLAVDCTRLTATCALSFGLAGYCSAALRAHQRFAAPAAVYVVYNTVIIAALFLLAAPLGVRAAATGVALGGVLMVVVQAPFLWRELRLRGGAAGRVPRGEQAVRLETAVIWTVLLFALCRQSQVLIERFLASSLPAGAISHLNYAQKVAQMPMVLSLMLCTVTFPVVARALAAGETERARDRVERDLVLAGCVVLYGAAAIVAVAPDLVHLLFQRGAFTAADTEATAAVMRVYALGLLGHTLVGALARAHFSVGRATWAPLAAMGIGLLTTAGIGFLTVGTWGVYGIAGANAAGICVTAVLLLHALGPRALPLRTRAVAAQLGRLTLAAASSAALGAWCAHHVGPPVAAVVTGGLVVGVSFLAVGWGLRVPALRAATARLSTPCSATRKRRHDS
ncbi:murein biosynthesis integral membrane protein MurJ [Streptomyces flavofungini]|uniref:murein biosynthesis integral membrane protein MurJ n=1 Tax=Streptomyces flavofungini TaxID=68200 RepID=UPI0025B1CC6D|nr:lipid II flippase MurJ [Streptomyces flavofungini]WJV47497.1 lipid II flippase MurJ [Streptomyces flavofungini]